MYNKPYQNLLLKHKNLMNFAIVILFRHLILNKNLKRHFDIPKAIYIIHKY